MEVKKLGVFYSCSAPFDNVDTSIYLQCNEESTFDTLACRIFYNFKQDREIIFSPSNAWMTNGEIVYGNSDKGLAPHTQIHENFHLESRKLKKSSYINITLEEAMAEVISDLGTQNDKSVVSKRVRDYWCSSLSSRNLDMLDDYVKNIQDYPASKWLKLVIDSRYYLYYELCMFAAKKGATIDVFYDAMDKSKADLGRGVNFLVSFCPELAGEYSFKHAPIFAETKYHTEFINGSMKVSVFTSDKRILGRIKSLLVLP